MKRLAAAITALLVTTGAYALGDKCITQPVVVGGVVKSCTTCCNSFGVCQTFCT